MNVQHQKQNGNKSIIFPMKHGKTYFYHLSSLILVLYYSGIKPESFTEYYQQNKYLNDIKAIPSPICSHCNQEETILHLLLTCPVTNPFLQKITKLAKKEQHNFTIY